MSKSKFSLEVDDVLEEQEIDRQALKRFASGAVEHKVVSDYVWEHEDPDELPTYNFRLRLNKYQIGLLKYVAKLERRSLSNMIKVILVDELLKRVKE